MSESLINRTAPTNNYFDPRGELSNAEVYEMVFSAFRASQDWRRPKEEQWEGFYRQWRSQAKVRDWPHNSSLVIPLTWATTQTFLPRMLSQRPQITIMARGDEDFEGGRWHRELMEWQWPLIGMPMTLQTWIMDSFIYGTGFVKDGWDKKIGPKPFRLDDGSEAYVEGAILKDEPYVANVDISSMYPAPYTRDIDSAPYIIEHSRRQWYELDMMADAGVYDKAAVGRLREMANRAESSEELMRLMKQRYTDFGFGDGEAAESTAGLYFFDVLEYWDDFNQYVIVLGHKEVLLRQRNPFWHGKKPYCAIADNIVPGELYGIGEAEILESIQDEVSDLHNIRMDAAKRATFNQYTIIQGSPAWWHDIRFTPEGKIPVRTQEDIAPLHKPGPAVATYREEDGLRIWHQFVSGASDQLVGLASELDSETATGASLLASASASRVGLKFLNLSEMGLRPLGRKWAVNNEQNMSDAVAMQVVGPQGIRSQTISPDMLRTYGVTLDVRIDVAATDPLNREIQKQKNVNLLGVLLPAYRDVNHPVIMQILKRIAELSDLDLSDEQLGTVPALQENMASQAQQQGGSTLRDTVAAVGGV